MDPSSQMHNDRNTRQDQRPVCEPIDIFYKGNPSSEAIILPHNRERRYLLLLKRVTQGLADKAIGPGNQDVGVRC
jgi:hypothetical protein